MGKATELMKKFKTSEARNQNDILKDVGKMNKQAQKIHKSFLKLVSEMSSIGEEALADELEAAGNSLSDFLERTKDFF